MYPLLFQIGDIPVHSYYFLWAFALSVGVIFTRFRASRLYGLDDDLVRKTLFFVFIGMLVGARLGGYLDHWTYYAEHPEKLFNPLEGALSSTTAFIGGGVAGIIYCLRKKISLGKLADAASIPAALTVAIGRIGCFLNGCCLSIPTDVPWAVHFPKDPSGLMRHPVQIYYSLFSLVIMLSMVFLEKCYLTPSQRKSHGAILWPLFMILYGVMRFTIDFIREGDRILGLRTAQISGVFVAVAGFIWILHTIGQEKDRSLSS